MSNVLCITGMHRSGTSLIASWLERCGLHIGNNQIGPSSGNPLGHFEDRDFVRLQDSSLWTLNQKTKGWIFFSTKEIRFNKDQFLQAQELVRKRNESYLHWGWKDPRTVIYLEQWKEIIPDLKVIFVWRPCVEVSQSLVSRSKNDEKNLKELSITIPAAVRLWISYNQRICRYKSMYSSDTILLPLEYILQQDCQVYDQISMWLPCSMVYHPISEIFERKFFHIYPAAKLPRFFCSIFKAYHLEKRLLNMSDIMNEER